MAKYKLLAGFDAAHTGEIFDTDKPVPNYPGWSFKWTWEYILNTWPSRFELIKENMCEKTIKLSLKQARKMYGKNPEMDELLLANFSKEELEQTELPTKFTDIEAVSGYRINYEGNPIFRNGYVGEPINVRIPRFATEKQALSTVAMAQLSQLMKVYNGDWQPNWSVGTPKYVICATNSKLYIHTGYNSHYFLAFKSVKIRDEFLKNFETLIKQYFMID